MVIFIEAKKCKWSRKPKVKRVKYHFFSLFTSWLVPPIYMLFNIIFFLRGGKGWGARGGKEGGRFNEMPGTWWCKVQWKSYTTWNIIHWQKQIVYNRVLFSKNGAWKNGFNIVFIVFFKMWFFHGIPVGSLFCQKKKIWKVQTP